LHGEVNLVYSQGTHREKVLAETLDLAMQVNGHGTPFSPEKARCDTGYDPRKHKRLFGRHGL
jgi:hypothetical protein